MEEQVCWDFDPESSVFDRDRHIFYLEMMYQMLPSAYQGQEINRLTLAYFVVSGLDILRAIDRIDKEVVINWVLSLQAHPKNDSTLENGRFYGFHGSRSSQFQSNDNGAAIPNGSHLASTYCALAILKTVGYDLSLMDSELLLKSMKNLQQTDGCMLAMYYCLCPDMKTLLALLTCETDYFQICTVLLAARVYTGTSFCSYDKGRISFMPIHIGGEADLRFVFCAAAICSMLKNWSGMDLEKAKDYIINCQSYDGGFGLSPGSESHVDYELKKYVIEGFSPVLYSILIFVTLMDGNCFSVAGGATYCAVASLKLMGFLEEDLLSRSASCHVINVPLLLDWTLQKQAQDGGFQGRANKPADTCYAFWIGGVLRILQADKFIDESALRGFLLTCQSEYGGFSKFPRLLPDLYHSYYGFCAFSLLKEPGLNSLCIELGITVVAAIGL
ncbi:hypothetical protein DH2020_022163 [Rehmannia glutinosa]|uniref:Prenyltransferase alpha-alpha toroid domain-containing protein n=1 Tax=Rehmannia glutinosa TaxID=99300 RepID=A0ABR0WCI1_REHGL